MNARQRFKKTLDNETYKAKVESLKAKTVELFVMGLIIMVIVVMFGRFWFGTW